MKRANFNEDVTGLAKEKPKPKKKSTKGSRDKESTILDWVDSDEEEFLNLDIDNVDSDCDEEDVGPPPPLDPFLDPEGCFHVPFPGIDIYPDLLEGYDSSNSSTAGTSFYSIHPNTGSLLAHKSSKDD